MDAKSSFSEEDAPPLSLKTMSKTELSKIPYSIKVFPFSSCFPANIKFIKDEYKCDHLKNVILRMF